MTLLLQRIGCRVGATINVQRGDFQLDSLPLRRRLDQDSGGGDAAASCDLLQNFFGYDPRVHDQLHALETRAVIQLDESNTLGVPARAYPATQGDLTANG